METIRGIVTRILKEGSFAAIEYEDPESGELLAARLSASLGGLSVGDAFLGDGYWKTGEFRGQTQYTFNSKNVRPAYPRSLPAIRKFLDLNLTPRETGIEKAAIHALCMKYGEGAIDELFGNPELLVEKSSNPDKFRDKIYEIVANKGTNMQARDLMVSAEFGDDEIGKVLERFKTNTLNTIMANPYDVLDVPEITFGKADKLGVKVGVTTADDRRITAAILSEIREAEDNGSSLINLSASFPEIAYRVGVTEKEVSDLVRRTVASKDWLKSKFVALRLPQSQDIMAISTTRHRHEVSAAQGIMKIIVGGRRNDREKARQVCETVLKGTRFDEYQYKAVVAGVTEPISCIIGGPGTGKSTIMKSIVEISRQLDAGEIYATATTGQASQRLEQTTGAQAVTLHSLLGQHQDPTTGATVYRHNAKNPLPENCVVIVDEFGMADNELFAGLISAMPLSGRLVLVGDRQQLLSVGVGQVLSDMQEMNIDGVSIIPVVRLVNTYRQDKDSKIVKDSELMQKGVVPHLEESLRGGTSFQECSSHEITSKIVKLFKNTFIPGKVNVLRDVAVITPQRTGPGGVFEINQALAEALNPGREPIPNVAHTEFSRYKEAPVPHVGDRVMLTDNDKTAGVVNGDMGFVRGYRPDPKRAGKFIIELEFDDGRTHDLPCSKWRDLILAYAITCHKSQGSQYPIVILPFSDAHIGMADRNLVFTAWTRAQKVVMGLGSKQVFAEFVTKNEKSKRYTLLRPVTEALMAVQKVAPIGERLEEPAPLRLPRADSYRLPSEAPVSVPKAARPGSLGMLRDKANEGRDVPASAPPARQRVPLSARNGSGSNQSHDEPRGAEVPPPASHRRAPLAERDESSAPAPDRRPPSSPPPSGAVPPAHRRRRFLEAPEADNTNENPRGLRP
jgi:exodeoxyribonuclease V alpha subunit